MAVVSLGVVASGTYVGGAGTLTLPFSTNIARSDPSGGATLIFWWASVSVPVGAAGGISIGVADDVPMDAFYNTCYYSDGLNPYSGNVSGAAYNSGGEDGPVTVPFGQALAAPAGCAPSYGYGLVLNPITTLNNLVVTIGGPGTGAVNIFAVAYTGCNITPHSGVNFPLSFWNSSYPQGQFGQFTDITDARTAHFAQWTFNSGTIFAQPFTTGTVGPPFIVVPRLPGTTVYPNWSIDGPGDIIVYTVGDFNHGGAWPGGTSPYGAYDHGSSGAWSWGGGGPTTINEFDDYDGNGDGMLASLLVAEQPLGGAAPIVGQDITGSWAGIASTYSCGGSFTLAAGAGPPQCVLPPTTNYPVFNSRWRAND